MKFQRHLTLIVTILFLSSGCLDSLDDSKSGGFWGGDCSEESSDCPDNPAPAFVLIDQHGETVNLSQFEGKIVVMTFVYTHCPDVCPAITYQMKKLAEELGDDYGESVVFLSVTVDPARDTPERLDSFSRAYNASWQFLTVNSTFPDNHMQAMWNSYKLDVLNEEAACSGQGHYMEGYEGCHCNPGYMQDPWNVDTCIVNPDYVQGNLTFEDGTLESEILIALDMWASGNVDASELMKGTTLFGQEVPGIRQLVSQKISQDWKLDDMNDTEHSSSTYYAHNLTLLEFFHTACPHCHAQIPALQEFQANYSSNVSLISIGGNRMSGNLDSVGNIENFTVEYNPSGNVTWTYLYDDSHSLFEAFGLNQYPSWILLDGDQVVGKHGGMMDYEELESFVAERSERVNLSEQMTEILDYLGHWDQGHISDEDMVEIIANSLNYEYEEDVENYGVSHSSRLYIIDQNGDIRVLWRGLDWTYASIYHDVQILL